MSNKVIVSRHPACIEFIAQFLSKESGYDLEVIPNYAIGLISNNCLMEDIPILSSAKEEDVENKVVYGNVPLNLASRAERVYALEFDTPPRGQEYTLEQMVEYGAKLVPYKVFKEPD